MTRGKWLQIGLIAACASLVPVAADARSTAQGMNMDDPYAPAMQSMDMRMMQARDSDPDRAFAKKMIEHHRGAVEMAQIALQHVSDPVMRRTARKVISEQKAEIAKLRRWLETSERKGR